MSFQNGFWALAPTLIYFLDSLQNQLPSAFAAFVHTDALKNGLLPSGFL